MKQLTKGEQTQQEILQRVNAYFNESGVDHTIAQIADHIGMGKSRVTNYFPRKELLLLALLKAYEKGLSQLIDMHQPDTKITDFRKFVSYLSDAMDLMYNYRGVIAHTMVNKNIDADLVKHLRDTYAKNRDRIYRRIENLVHGGHLSPGLLEPDAFEVFSLHYLGMNSTWIIRYDLMGSNASYKAAKPIFLKAIFCCLKPYLTPKGKQDLEASLEAVQERIPDQALR